MIYRILSKDGVLVTEWGEDSMKHEHSITHEEHKSKNLNKYVESTKKRLNDLTQDDWDKVRTSKHVKSPMPKSLMQDSYDRSMELANNFLDGDESINPHYYKKGIECIDYIKSKGMNYMEGNVVKYVTRYKDKNGVEDLKKARWYLDQLISSLE